MLLKEGTCMQVNSVVNLQIIQKKQNFKGSFVNSSPFLNFPSYKPISLETFKAYASPLITQGYKEIETFDVPCVGQGKLYELANGHKIAIVQKPGPTVINTFVKAGRHESLISGHLLEHLLYESNNEVDSKSLSDFFVKYGIKRRATTWDNYTNYYMQYPFNDLKGITDLDIEQGSSNDLSKIIPDLQTMIEHRDDLELGDIVNFDVTDRFNQIIDKLEKITSITLKQFPDCADEAEYALTSPNELVAFAMQKRQNHEYDQDFIEILNELGIPQMNNNL